MMRTLIAALSASLVLLAPLSAELPRPAGALEFRTPDGKGMSLEDFKGKVVGVMFFSTDCPHCQDTADILAPIYQEYKPKGVEFIGLAVNPSAVTGLAEFVKNHKVEYITALGNGDQWSRFADMSATARKYVPHLLFVDREGNVVEDHPGLDRQFWMNQEELIRATLDRLTQ